MSQEVLPQLWLNAQYCSTVQTLYTQTQEEDALIDTNQEVSTLVLRACNEQQPRGLSKEPTQLAIALAALLG